MLGNSHREKELLLKISQNLKGNTCTGVSFLKKLQDACNFINKGTPERLFAYEFSKLFRVIFFSRPSLYFMNF